jgi:hypothetical protein
MVQRQGLLASGRRADGPAEQQPGHHPARQRQVTLVADGSVLTQETGQISLESGGGVHEGLVWCDDPRLSRLPAQPMT